MTWVRWEGVKPCDHPHLWMTNTKECSDCHAVRLNKEPLFRDAGDLEPFEAGADDQQHWDDSLERITPVESAKAPKTRKRRKKAA